MAIHKREIAVIDPKQGPVCQPNVPATAVKALQQRVWMRSGHRGDENDSAGAAALRNNTIIGK